LIAAPIILSPSLLRMIDGAQAGPGGASQSKDVFMQRMQSEDVFLAK
jgi:hypothetical protein